MEIAVLGGHGEMGRVAVHHLLSDDRVDGVTVVDQQREVSFESDVIAHERLDIGNQEALAGLLSGFDCVANCAPFRFNLPVTEAAIEAGTDLVDLGTYDSSLVKQQLALDEEANAADATIVPGIGASPGLTNVLARYAADRLATVEAVHIRWSSQRPVTASPGLLATALEEPLLERTQYVDGVWTTDATPFAGEEDVEFLDWGSVQCFDVPHPEPITIPRVLDGVDTVTVKGGWGESNRLLRTVTELGLTRETPQVVGTTPRAFIEQFLLERVEQSVDSRFSLSVSVVGTADGSDVEFTYDLPTVTEADCEAYPFSVLPVGIPTGVPMAVASLLVAADRTTESGVQPPEAAFDPDEFLEEIRNYLRLRETVRETGPV